MQTGFSLNANDVRLAVAVSAAGSINASLIGLG